MIHEQGNSNSNNNEQQKEEQGQKREFSSIFVFKIKMKVSSGSSLFSPQNNNDIDSLNNLLTSNGFKFESEAYQSGFGKLTIFEKKILEVSYYDIIEEIIVEDTTNKEKPGEIKQETKILPTQKIRYIIDTNIFANEDLVFICRTDRYLNDGLGGFYLNKKLF